MKERIEYIDALRGFTMLLVVYAHVRLYGYHQIDDITPNSFNSFFLFIRMPLFFFISGFLFYKKERNHIGEFILNKAKIQLLPSFIFMFLYAFLFNYNFYDGLFDVYKLGYWFTIALFMFFIVFIAIDYILSLSHLSVRFKDYIWLIVALIFHFATTDKCMHLLGLYGKTSLFLGIIQFKYFLFFIIGILIKKHFKAFMNWKDKKYTMAILIIAFFVVTIPILKFSPLSHNVWFKHFIFIYTGCLGIFIIFLYFNKYQNSFTSQTLLGKTFQYIGKRTLDIYLLHYFFLPRDLEGLGNHFVNFANPCLEIFISIGLSFMVIGLCLITSNIIRISPWLGKHLLGAKK